MSEPEWQIPVVALAVDLAVLTIRQNRLQILLVERGEQPYLGKWALPGGFLESTDEDVDDAAARELAEETGLAAEMLHLEQLRTYGAAHRDPRMRVVTVCYLALVPDLPLPTAGGDARAAQWRTIDEVITSKDSLAFDHVMIIKDALERARGKLEYTTLGAAFCDSQFTMTELRQVYEIVWGEQLDPGNFHRKISNVEGFLLATGERTARNGGRPAALYRRGSVQTLHPPILRGSGPSHSTRQLAARQA